MWLATYPVKPLCYLLEKGMEVGMEPIVLLGLVVVVYGGYVAAMELLEDISVLFPRRARSIRTGRSRELGRKPCIKKMAGMHI